MFQADVKGMSERSKLIPCDYYYNLFMIYMHEYHYYFEKKGLYLLLCTCKLIKTKQYCGVRGVVLFLSIIILI